MSSYDEAREAAVEAVRWVDAEYNPEYVVREAIDAFLAKLSADSKMVMIPHPRTMTRARASAYITIILRHCGPEAGEDESAMDRYLAEARAMLAQEVKP